MSGYCNECGNTLCVCGEAAAAQDVKSGDREALDLDVVLRTTESRLGSVNAGQA